jgi:hypothetical protein
MVSNTSVLEKIIKSDSGRLILDGNEMAFRSIFRTYLEQKSITTVFRPGSRNGSLGDERGYSINQIVYAKVLRHIGSDYFGNIPIFEDKKVLIQIKSVDVILFTDLNETSFCGATKFIHDKLSLMQQLCLIYNLSEEDFTEDFLVTRISFSYL